MMTITIPSPRAARSYGIEANPLKACNFLLIIAFFFPKTRQVGAWIPQLSRIYQSAGCRRNQSWVA